jgi:hypothetical protein
MKFKLTAETKEFYGIKLFRIEALIDFNGIKKGDKGGFIEKESNLSQVYGDAWVSGDAWVYGNAQVSGDARVYGDAWEKSPLFIVGSRHSLTNAKHGHIQIGCLCNTFKWWAGHYKAVGKQQGYTPAEIKEYGAYIALFSKVGQKEVKVKK